MALGNLSCSDHVLEKEGFCWEIQQSKPFKVYSIDFSKWNENLPRKNIDFRNLVLTSPSLSVFLPFIPAFVNLAATTKYHRLSDLNHKHFSLRFWSLRSLRSRCSSQVRAHFLVCPTRQRERGTLRWGGRNGKLKEDDPDGRGKKYCALLPPN